jgi:uncharacterized protein RhaS with RHS repeats
MYQPELGRFLQPDPKQFAAGDYNLYRYCHNDPVNKTDPMGLIDEGHMEPEGLDATVRGSQAILAYVGNQIAEMYREDPVGFIFLVATMGRASEGEGIRLPRLSPSEGTPRLVTNPKHHFNSESPQPKNFKQLFQKSITDKSGARWAKDKDGTIHRFSKPSNGESHWNGSTAGRDPIKEQNIPNDIKKKLGE